MTRRRAELKARELLFRNGAPRPPIDVNGLAESIGLEVFYDDELDADLSGFLLRQGGRSICVVNDQMAKNRKRFTLAHELGHLLLHPARESYDYLERGTVSSQGSNLLEIEANAFAAELLMPAVLIRARVERPVCDDPFTEEADEIIKRLATEFEVSEQAMAIRLRNLGLLLEP